MKMKNIGYCKRIFVWAITIAMLVTIILPGAVFADESNSLPVTEDTTVVTDELAAIADEGLEVPTSNTQAVETARELSPQGV
jgi:hypothetical protein